MNIPIDEQIARQRAVIRHCEGKSGINIDGDKAILASLEKPAALESQPVPVEPAIVGWLEHHKAGDNIGWEQVDHHYAKADALIKKSDYDTLRDYAVQADIAAKIHAKDVFNLTEKVIPNIRERAEKAESLNRRMLELLKEPSEELWSAAAEAYLDTGEWVEVVRATGAELIKEVEK